MEHTKIALFVDTENLTQWIKGGGPEDLLSELGASGQIIVRRAYGNWGNSSIQSFQAVLNRLGFELIHNFHPVSKKNSSDIQLTIDVIEYALRLHDVNWFVLATGDSDFSPLFRRLREMGKDVIGVGPRSPLSESVKTSCSRFIYTNLESPESEPPLEPSDSAKEIHSAIDDVMDIAERILKTSELPIPLSSLKNKILNIDSAFSEKNLGFNSFLDFLKSNTSILLTQNEKNNSWLGQLKHKQPEVIPPEQKDEPLEKQYEKLLRSKQWRPVPSTALKTVYEALDHLGQASKEKVFEKALENTNNTITQTDTNKAFAILRKAGVFKHSATDAMCSETLWKIDNGINFILAVDLALLSRLITACREQKIAIENDPLRNFIYGKYDNTTFNNLLEKASCTMANA